MQTNITALAQKLLDKLNTTRREVLIDYELNITLNDGRWILLETGEALTAAQKAEAQHVKEDSPGSPYIKFDFTCSTYWIYYDGWGVEPVAINTVNDLADFLKELLNRYITERVDTIDQSIQNHLQDKQ